MIYGISERRGTTRLSTRALRRRRSVGTPKRRLSVHGEEDRTNPVGQSSALYRALKYFGVEAELVTYPGEDHLPQPVKHQVDILQRILDWL